MVDGGLPIPHFIFSFQEHLSLVACGTRDQDQAILPSERPCLHGDFALPIGAHYCHLHLRAIRSTLHFVVRLFDNLRGSLCRCNDARRSEEHTSELQSRENLVCRLLLEKKKK